jgi:hypothetical protein
MIVRRLGACLILAGTLDAIHAAQPASPPGDPIARGPRTDHAVGYYDERLQRVVLVGAAGDPVPNRRDTVWSWSGARWDRVSDGPEGRVNAGAAYDADRGRAIVAGGARKAADGRTWQVVGDTWESDGSGWRPIAGIAPRDHHALVEDGRGGVLMFGGIPASRPDPWPADTWRLRAGAWSRVAVADGPQARGRTALVYDSRRRQVVLFGGVSAPSGPGRVQAFLDDTWVWNGERWWKAADGGPRGRYAHGMAFDARARIAIMYGGAAAHRDALLADMWQWDGDRWTEIRLTGPTPGHRYQPVMVYDRARDRTVLYGGIGGASDTWEWNGQRWRQVAR